MTKAVQDDAETMEDVVDAHVIDHLVNGPATHSELMTKAREVDAEIARLTGNLKIAITEHDRVAEALQQAHAERDALAAALRSLLAKLGVGGGFAGSRLYPNEEASVNITPDIDALREALTRMGESEATT